MRNENGSLLTGEVNGRHRRNSRHHRLGKSSNDTIVHIFKRSRRMRRHHHGEDLELKISLAQTKHRMRIIKIQPSVKRDMEYMIVKGNENGKFELLKKHGVWALHFKRRLRRPGAFDLIIHGRPNFGHQKNETEIYEKPLTLRIRLIVTE